MVKLNVIHQKACLINWSLEAYNIKQQFNKFYKNYIFKAQWNFIFSHIQFYFLPNSVFY